MTRYRVLLALPWLLAGVAAILFVVVVPHDRDVGPAWNALVKGAAAAGMALVSHIGALGRTDVGVVGAIASDLCDLASLILIAPMLLTSVALRGGLLGRPWFMLTAGQLSWLVYDLLAFADAVALRE